MKTKKGSLLLSLFFTLVLPVSGQSGDMASRKLNMALYAIENMYVDKVDENKLAEDAIISLLKELDPHSNYLNKEEVKEMNEPLQGNFEGIGIQFNMLTDTLYVVSVISGGPSEKVGLLAGDRIIQVDDTIISGVKMKNSDIMKRLRGKKGTEVRVKVLRNNVPGLIEFKIIRGEIPIYSLDASYMIDKETGYIRLSRFAATSYNEFMKAFNKLQQQGMKNLIFDLQGNGGGYLNVATDIANEFLGAGKTIVYTEGAKQRRDDMKASGRGNFEKGKLIVLIDETSASASEIVSGALQDWDRAVLVGRRSFGKGLVQRPIQLPDGSMIRLTTARYYTPTGRCIQKPYEKGNKENYEKDWINRYNHGEMISADSIHFPDSLKYGTLVNKRTVYGGGGIMPDYFVPIDTTKYTPFFRNIVAKGILNRTAIKYIDSNRDFLKKEYQNVEKFSQKYQVPENLMEDLLKAAKDAKNSKNIESEEDESEISVTEISPKNDSTEFSEKDMEEYNRSKPLIELQLKSLIARDLWDMNEYFYIFNQESNVFKKAVEIIKKPEEYNKLLKGK